MADTQEQSYRQNLAKNYKEEAKLSKGQKATREIEEQNAAHLETLEIMETDIQTAASIKKFRPAELEKTNAAKPAQPANQLCPKCNGDAANHGCTQCGGIGPVDYTQDDPSKTCRNRRHNKSAERNSQNQRPKETARTSQTKNQR